MARTFEGFQFTSDEDLKMAKEEAQRINYISEKLNANDPESILLVYNKSIQSNVFTSPIGLDFLKSVQSYLKKSEAIDNSQILDIPVRYSISDALVLHENARYDSLNKKEKKSYKNEFRSSLLINGILLILVILMFVITLKADNPNILNYKNALEDKYATWEQDLTERENNLKQREAELNGLGD